MTTRRLLAFALVLSACAVEVSPPPAAGSDAGASSVPADAALPDASPLVPPDAGDWPPGDASQPDSSFAETDAGSTDPDGGVSGDLDAAFPGDPDAASAGEDAASPAGEDAASPAGEDASLPGPDASQPEPGEDAGPSCPDFAQRQTFGMNIDPANPGGNPSAAELKALGARWARVEFKVPLGYPPHDAVIGALRGEGVRVMLLLDYSSVAGKPASNAGDAEWTSYLAAFNAGVADIGSHYGDGVDAWQIWNEPDLFNPGTGYDPGVPARHFGVMLRDSVTTLRARSTRPIVTAGLASGQPSYLQEAINAVGGVLSVDAVSVHPYGQRAPDGWPDPSWGFGEMSNLFNAYLAFGKPLWVSEIGTIDTVRQAQYLTNVYDLVLGSFAGSVERVFWFCWSDAMVPPFGVVNADGTHKASYHAYRAAAPPWSASCDAIP